MVAHPPLRGAVVCQSHLPWCWDGAPRFGVAVQVAVPGVWIGWAGRRQDVPLTLTTGTGASRTPPRSVAALHWGPQGRQTGVVWQGEPMLTCSLVERVDLLLASWDVVWRLRIGDWWDRPTCEQVARPQEIWRPQA